MNPKVDAYLSNAKTWRDESEKLRGLILKHPVTEEFKWGKPCYTFNGANLFIIQGFKDSCALLFCKGALLKDPHGVLEKPGENTQAARRLKFTSVQQVAKLAPVLKSYIAEAIAAEQAGLEVEYKKTPEPVPAELEQKWKSDSAFKAAFQSLTPGRRRAYILHFSAPKQSATRASRIEKARPQILEGKGLHDDFRLARKKK